METMLFTLLFAVSTLTIISAFSIPPVSRRGVIEDGYVEKLLHLQKMLDAVSKQSRRDVHTVDYDVIERNRKLKQLATRLVEGDEKALRIVEDVLQKTLNKRNDIDETEGSVQHKQTATDSLASNLKDLLEKYLGTELTSTHHDPAKFAGTASGEYAHLKTDHDLVPRYRVDTRRTKDERPFTNLRRQVMRAIEDKLLRDLKLALNSGFTIRDLIGDLVSGGDLTEDSKRREISRELDSLDKLKNSI